MHGWSSDAGYLSEPSVIEHRTYKYKIKQKNKNKTSCPVKLRYLQAYTNSFVTLAFQRFAPHLTVITASTWHFCFHQWWFESATLRTDSHTSLFTPTHWHFQRPYFIPFLHGHHLHPRWCKHFFKFKKPSTRNSCNVCSTICCEVKTDQAVSADLGLVLHRSSTINQWSLSVFVIPFFQFSPSLCSIKITGINKMAYIKTVSSYGLISSKSITLIPRPTCSSLSSL